MKNLILISFCLFVSSAYALNGVYPLMSLEVDAPLEELAPVDKWIDGAEVVGVGESGHGSSGYLLGRLRLIRYLVEKHNFRMIALELGYKRADVINNYLNLCHQKKETITSYQAALGALDVDIYRNKEMAKTIHWLCEFNKIAKESVVFHGIDIWESPWINRDLIKKALPLVNEPDFTTAYQYAFENCFAWKANSWSEASQFPEWAYLLRTWRLDPARHIECIGGLLNMDDLIQEVGGSSDEVFWARLAIRVENIYQQYRDLYRVDIRKALDLRDGIQAWLLLEMRKRYGQPKKTIFLAHNIHISKKQSAVVPPSPGDPEQWVDVRSAGEKLVGHLGRGYRAIALTGYNIASSRDGQYPLPTREDSLDYYLSGLNQDYLLVDTDSTWIKLLGHWWMHAENVPNGSFLTPGEQYDGIIFLKKSEAANPISSLLKVF